MVGRAGACYPKRMRRIALGLGFLLAGCGDDGGGAAADEGSSGGAVETGATGDSGAPGSTGGGSDATGASDTAAGSSSSGETGATETGDTDDVPPVEPPALCDDIELPARDGAEIVVSPVSDGVVMVEGVGEMSLRAAVSSASPGDTVLLADGTYVLPEANEGGYSGIYITTPDVTLRSLSGDPTAVVIDSMYRSHGNSSAPITIAASGVVVANLTVTRSIFHLIHLWADGDAALIHGVHMVDGGQQFLKSSVEAGTVDAVEVSCSQFRMTDEGRDNVWGYGPSDGNTTCYTGGIDTHNATDWYVHDNLFEGIYCDADGVQRPAHGRFPEQRDNMTYVGGLSEHAIHMWDSQQGTGHQIVRNRIVNCARGIGIGLVDTVYGTRVLNNMVFSEHAGSREHDVGIIIERGVDMLVAHNTVFMSHPDAYASGIEYRFGETSNVTLHGNLSNRDIRARDGAQANLVGNVVAGEGAWFLDPLGGDLHVLDCSPLESVDRHAEVPEDFDGTSRDEVTLVGADVCE